MLRWSWRLVFLLWVLPAYACDVVDDAGNIFHVTKPAQRIVSLAPDITENLFAIGAGDHLVGVVMGSDYPSAARAIPIVGSYAGIDLERMVLLRPDLVVAWSFAFTRQLMVLKKMGIPVYITQPRRLEDVPRTLRNLGCLTGREKTAQVEANRFLSRLAQLKQRYQKQAQVSVFYEIGTYSLMTINRDSWINQLIDLCRGRNVFAGMTSITPEVSWEAVVAANPDVIINDSPNPQWVNRWKRWPQITAVKQGRFVTLPADWIERAGPRLIEGATQLCEALHHFP